MQTSIVVLLLTISGIQCQDHSFTIVLDTQDDFVYPWGMPVSNEELYFSYHADVSKENLSHNISQYLEDAGVLDNLSATNANGVWVALHERDHTDKCKTSTTTKVTNTPEISTVVSISTTVSHTTTDKDMTETTTTEKFETTNEEVNSTTQEPCLTKDFPIIYFSVNDYNAITLETFSMDYFCKKNATDGESQMIVFTVTNSTAEQKSYITAADCNKTGESEFWKTHTMRLNVNDIKIAIQLQSILPGDVILVDKMVMKTKGLAPTTPRNPTTKASTSTMEPTSSKVWTTSTPTPGYSSNASEWALGHPYGKLIICTLTLIHFLITQRG